MGKISTHQKFSDKLLIDINKNKIKKKQTNSHSANKTSSTI